MVEPSDPEVTPDMKRLGLVMTALLLLAIGLALVINAQIFEVHIRGTFGEPMTDISSSGTVYLGLVGLLIGIFMLGVALGGFPNHHNKWGHLGLIIGVLLIVIGLLPFPSWEIHEDPNSLEQEYGAKNEPGIYSQNQFVNVLGAILFAYACLIILFWSLHDLVAPKGSPILPREGMDYTAGSTRPFMGGESGPPLIQCPSCLRRFVATGKPKHCPGCGQPLADTLD